MNFIQYLHSNNACPIIINWAETGTYIDAINTCHRGDCLLWLAEKVLDRKKVILAAVKCARTVQHLMKSQKSIYKLDIAEKYANNKTTIYELVADFGFYVQEEVDGSIADSAASLAFAYAVYAAASDFADIAADFADIADYATSVDVYADALVYAVASKAAYSAKSAVYAASDAAALYSPINFCVP